MPSRELADFVELRLRMLRQKRKLYQNPRLAQLVTRDLKTALAAAKQSGIIATWHDPRSKKLRAAVLLYLHTPFYALKPERHLQFLFREGDRAALSRVRDILKEIGPELPKGTTVRLDPHHAALIPDLRETGLHIESLILVGRVEVARKALHKMYGPLDWSEQSEYRAIPIKTAKQVEASVQNARREFSRNPQFGHSRRQRNGQRQLWLRFK